MNIEINRNQINLLENSLSTLKQHIRFILELMDVEGFRHSHREKQAFTEFRNIIPNLHYLELFSKILNELSVTICALSILQSQILSFEETFKQNSYICLINSVTHEGQNILYTLQNPFKVYVGALIQKVRQGQGIETYNSELEQGSSEGQWENDQLMDGIKIIQKNNQERYQEGHWNMERENVIQEEWDKDRYFQNGVLIITDREKNEIKTYKGQWSDGQFQQGTSIIENDVMTNIYDGVWHDEIFYRGNHRIIDKESKETIESTGEWQDGCFKGLKCVSGVNDVTIYDGVWNKDSFQQGTKEVTNKVNDDQIQTKFSKGSESQQVIVQNPYTEMIFTGILSQHKKYLEGKLHQRTNLTNFYQGSFQDQNQKLEGSEYVNNQLRYKGTYKNNKYHGNGVLFQSDGAAQYKHQLISFKCQFVNGAMHGLCQRMKATENFQISKNDKLLEQKQYKIVQV